MGGQAEVFTLGTFDAFKDTERTAQRGCVAFFLERLYQFDGHVRLGRVEGVDDGPYPYRLVGVAQGGVYHPVENRAVIVFRMEVEMTAHHVVALEGHDGIVSPEGHQVVTEALADGGVGGVEFVGSAQQFEV